MNFLNNKILIVLPHLDDEFAIAPFLKMCTKKNEDIKVLFCAERRFSNNEKQMKRRLESRSSLNYLGIKSENVNYLNDKFLINDTEIYNSQANIYAYLNYFHNLHKFETYITLSLEGGHPDHDALSLIIHKFSKKNNINTLYFPAYNYRKTLFFIPFSLLRPLKSQKYLFKKKKLGKFCWYHSFKVALIYRTEWIAFLKIMPFIIFNIIFSNYIFYAYEIQIDNIEWSKSLTFKRYKKDFNFLSKSF